MTEPSRPPLEFRSATMSEVNFAERLITLIAVPYEQEATIEYRGELWQESFMRGAFDGLEGRIERVGVNRDHNKSKTVGKAVEFWPAREEGLVAEIRIAKTKDGDDTLALANEDMISPSVGFGVRGSDQILNRPYRKIKRAFLDHISFVETPAYPGAKVLTVREGEETLAADLPKLVTPRLDEIQAWLLSRQIS